MPRLRKADAAIGEGPAVLVAGAEARRASRRQAGLTRETKPNTEYSGFGLLQAEPAAGNTSLFAPRGRKGFGRGRKPPEMGAL